MVGARSQDVDFLVTPNHTIYAYFDNQWQQTTASKLKGTDCYVPTTDDQYPLVAGHHALRIKSTDWYTQQGTFDVYCPTVPTGYVLTRRNGKCVCLGNTNPSQLMQAGLGKVAAKTGKPIVMPQFMPKGQSRLKYVKDLMKKSNVPWS